MSQRATFVMALLLALTLSALTAGAFQGDRQSEGANMRRPGPPAPGMQGGPPGPPPGFGKEGRPPMPPDMVGPDGDDDPLSFGGPPDPREMGRGMGRRMRHGFMPSFGRLFEKLGLTEDQLAKIRQMAVESRSKTRKSRLKAMELMDEKKTMLMSGKIDMKKLTDIDEELIKAKTEIQRERLKGKRDLLGLLTPDQLKKLADSMNTEGFGSPFGGSKGGRGRGRHMGW